MGLQHAHVVLPHDLIAEIDATVGKRDRDAFVAETTRAELNRRKLLAFLKSKGPVMKDEDHPEFADGTEAWVQKTRLENETRMAVFESDPAYR